MTSPRSQYLWLLLALLLALTLQALALPPMLSAARPSWVAMIIGFWAYRSSDIGLMLPTAVAGLCLDVLFDTALGTHVIALAILLYIILKLRSFLTMSPLWQISLLLAPVWALYSFVLFWVDGATPHAASPLARWLPVLSTTIGWPLLFLVAELTRPMTRKR